MRFDGSIWLLGIGRGEDDEAESEIAVRVSWSVVEAECSSPVESARDINA